MSDAILHRCRTPTDWLCPCGRVARELRRNQVDYAEIRHPWRKRDRSDVLDVSGQAVLPVLEWADGEAICDSKRIVTSVRAGAPANGGRPKSVAPVTSARAGAPANGGRPESVAAKRDTDLSA